MTPNPQADPSKMPGDTLPGLSAEAKALRKLSIGGSDANVIAHGTKDQLDRLYLEKRGETIPPSLADRDPDANLPAMMGQWTEELNRRWFTRQTGLVVTDPGKRFVHPTYQWLTATVDGFADSAVFEAKHVNPFDFDHGITDRYMAQMQHNMFVTGATKAVLSVFVGNARWLHYWVDFDPFWHADLLRAELAFWTCVKNGTPPDGWAVGKIAFPSILDMTGNQSWASLAADYRAASGRIKKATERLRAMVPARVPEARGGGIIVKRDARGTPRVSLEEGS